MRLARNTCNLIIDPGEIDDDSHDAAGHFLQLDASAIGTYGRRILAARRL
jgi:hypothetical protein